MALYDIGEGRLCDFNFKITFYINHPWGIIMTAAAIHLVDKPQPLLGIGQLQLIIAINNWNIRLFDIGLTEVCNQCLFICL